MTGAKILALQLNVKCCLVLTHASSMPRMLEPLGILTWTRSQFISETIMRKTGQIVISEHLCMPATQLFIR